MRSNYINHAKQVQISGQQTLYKTKYGQELHKAKPKHESIVTKSHDTFLGKMRGYKASVLSMRGAIKPTWDRGKTC